MAAVAEQQGAPAHAAEEEEEEQAEAAEAGHSSDDDECEASASASESVEGGGAKKGKKKKKKKRKGGGGGGAGGGGGGAQPPAADPAARREGERRFQEAVEQLAHNSDDSMWVKLAGCHLADAKLKKLCEALKGNTTCISLDLSANQLTDGGAKALAAALADGRAPDLIDLDLRDNPQIQQEGAAALGELQQHRKTLRVSLGPSQPPEQAPPQAPQAQGAPPPPQPQQQANGTLADQVKSNPVISKYFAVGNDEADDPEEEPAGAGGAAGDDGAAQSFGGLTEAELAQILWDQLEQCLDAPQPSIAAVSEPLRAIAEQVEHEMDNSTLPLPPTVEMGELRTFTQWALRKLHVLHSALDLVPAPLLTTYSKDVPVPAVGTHRTAVAELLAQLLRSQAPVVVQLVAASGVPRRCAKIAVAHPNCSAIHGAVARCLKLSLAQPVGHVGLWHQLLGSAPLDAYGGAVGADHGASLNLAVEASRIAAAGAAAPTIGKRPANVGFALVVGQLLHAAATGEQLGGAPASAEGEQQQQAQQEQQQQQEPEGSQAAPPAGGSPPPEQQQQQQQQQQAGGPAEGASSGSSSGGASPPISPADDGSNPLKPKPGVGLRRISSSSGIPRVASAAVSDIPDEADSWTGQLHVQLATEEAWVDFSTGPDCLLRRMLQAHEGDLGGPRPRPGGPPEPEEEDSDVPAGQIISGQELLMMLRGLNLGGFSGGM